MGEKETAREWWNRVMGSPGGSWTDPPARVTCPFRLCGANPRILTGGTPDSTITEKHQLPPIHGPAATCPGSLQRWPFDAGLGARMRELEKAYPSHVPDPQTGHYEPKFTGPVAREPFPVTGRGKPKLGPNDPAWQRGGRKDEDVTSSTDDVRGPIPAGVSGQPMGRAGMATANELAAMVNAAGAQGAEAHQLIASAKDALGRACGIYMEVSTESETMRSAVTALNEAVEKLSEAQGAIDTAAEYGETYNARLFM